MPRLCYPAVLLIVSITPRLACASEDLQTELQSATQAMHEGNYQRAWSRFKRHGNDNPLAQFNLGLLAQNGWGRPIDEQEACRWFEKAASGNIPTAQHFFGICMAKGIGRPADIPGAIAWLKQAADGGHLMSLCTAGQIYIEGEGIERDIRRGIELCAQGAQMGVPTAMLALADYYRSGSEHIPQDLTAARYWYTQAAEHRSPEGQYRLGLMLSEGLGGATDLTAALLWLETAASEGYAEAYLPTAILYANADPQADTGALAPEHLAKIYVWLMAAKATNTDPLQAAEIERIETIVMAVMPEEWKSPLDEKVLEHLGKYAD